MSTKITDSLLHHKETVSYQFFHKRQKLCDFSCLLKEREGRRLRRREQNHLEELEERERYLAQREHHLEAAERSCIGKCLVVCRPFQIFFGILFLIMEMLVFVSLLLTK